MTIKAATEGQLGSLHSKVAAVMTGAINVIDAEQEDYLEKKARGEPDLIAPVPNASLLAVITKFLADNDISCVPEQSAELSDLEKTLQNRRAKRRSVGNVVHLAE